MGRTVQDVALLLGTQAGYDQRIPLSIANYVDYTGATGIFDCKNTRIGWLGDLSGYLAMEPGILDVCEQGLARFAGLGCAVEPIALGTAPEPVWQAWLVWRRGGGAGHAPAAGGRWLRLHGQPAQPGRVEQRVWFSAQPRQGADVARS